VQYAFFSLYLNLGNGALLEIDAVGGFVARHQVKQKLGDAGVVADHHDRLALTVMAEQIVELIEVCLRAHGIADDDPVLIAELRNRELCRLYGADQRAGDHSVNLHAKSDKGLSYNVALLLAELVDGALVVVFGKNLVLVRTGVTQEVNEHEYIVPEMR